MACEFDALADLEELQIEKSPDTPKTRLQIASELGTEHFLNPEVRYLQYVCNTCDICNIRNSYQAHETPPNSARTVTTHGTVLVHPATQLMIYTPFLPVFYFLSLRNVLTLSRSSCT